MVTPMRHLWLSTISNLVTKAGASGGHRPPTPDSWDQAAGRGGRQGLVVGLGIFKAAEGCKSEMWLMSRITAGGELVTICTMYQISSHCLDGTQIMSSCSLSQRAEDASYPREDLV